MNRRNYLSLLGVSAVAGCADIDDDEEVADDADDQADDTELSDDLDDADEPDTDFPSFELPAYSEWLPTEPRTGNFVLFGHLNIHHLHEADNEEDVEEEPPTPEDDEHEVLFILPGYGFMVTAFWFYFGLWGTPGRGHSGAKTSLMV